MFSERDTSELSPIRHEPDGTAIVRGDSAVRDWNREMSLDLEEQDGSPTLAGLSLSLAGRMPKEGNAFTADDGTVLTVRNLGVRHSRRACDERAPSEE